MNIELKTPCYLYDLEKFKANIENFRTEVKKYYPNYRLGYSYKTNYFRRFCDAVNELGEYAEIVSPKEFEMAYVNDDVPLENIIYNGVIKDFANKLAVAKQGGIVNIENIAEFRQFVDWSNDQKFHLNLGVRLNVDIGSGIPSRFGIDVEGEDFKWLADADNRPYIHIRSVHGHFSQARSLQMFENRVSKMCHYADILGASIVDIGGNMFGNMKEYFKNQFDVIVPSFHDYAKAIGEKMRECCPDCSKVLITEDGTPIVSDAMHLMTSILNVKNIKGRVYIDIDTKREDVGASCITKNPAHIHFGKESNYVSHGMVSGCTCVEIDNIIRDYNGYANVGDKLLLLNIGAYSLNTTNDFITDGCEEFVDIRKYPEIREQIERTK